MPFKPAGPLAMTLQGAHVAVVDKAGMDGLRLSEELVSFMRLYRIKQTHYLTPLLMPLILLSLGIVLLKRNSSQMAL